MYIYVCVYIYDGSGISVGIAGLSSMSDNRSNYAVISKIKLEVIISDQIQEASLTLYFLASPSVEV